MSSLSRRHILILGACACGAGVSGSIAVAQSGTPTSGSRLALDGYDPISYFDPGSPEKGSPQFSFAFDDAVYWFKSADHLAKFVTDPERYAPQYGGYCAYGTSQGHKAPTEVETWTIVDGKLYFNYNAKVKEMWLKDQKAYIEKADKTWPEIKQKS